MVHLSSDLELAAVERHLKYDEESSVETSPSITESSEKKRRRRRSPPSTFPPPSPMTSGSRILTPEADLWSQVGMALAFNKDLTSPRREDDETLSVTSHNSSNQSIDSDKELELMANEIRKNLRDSELKELAAEAERAADLGHDSFTGAASTFGDSPTLDLQEVKVKKPTFMPLRMRRHYTYSEGLATPLRINSADRKLRRKIPVMALRQMDEVVPPFTELHLHLRSHLYNQEVETEKSSVDKPIDYSILEKNADEMPNAGDGKGVSFLQKMKQWVGQAKESGSFDSSSRLLIGALESKDSYDDDDDHYEVGDVLSEHFTSQAVASGNWKPSAVKIPHGLIPPASDDFVNVFETPNHPYKPPISMVKRTSSLLLQSGDQTLETTASTESSSSTLAEKSIEIVAKAKSDPNLPCGATAIKPITLFDDDESVSDDKDEDPAKDPAEDVVVSLMSLQVEATDCDFAATSLPCPITPIQSEFQLPIPKQRRVSPNSIPNLFITPVRLKGVRDGGMKTQSPLPARSNLSWSFPRTDSLASDPGRIPASVMVDVSSTSDIVGGIASLLKPRNESVTAMFDELMIHELHHMEDMEEPLIELIPMDMTPTRSLLSQRNDNRLSSSLADSEPQPLLADSFSDLKQGFLTPLAQSPDRKGASLSIAQNNSAIEPVKLFQNEEIFKTPVLSNCECIALNQMESTDCEMRQIAPAAPPSPATSYALRRVTSCPSLADTWDDDIAAEPGRERRSFLNVFSQLSPKSKAKQTRRLYFPARKNNEFLNNYLYCRKPPDMEEHEGVDLTQGPLCIGCEMTGPCDLTGLKQFASGKSLFVQKASTRLLNLDKGDYVVQNTWFDSAAENFDGAMERLVGGTGVSDSKWGVYFRAPALSMTTPPNGTKRSSLSMMDERDPAKVKCILLTPSTSSAEDSHHNGFYGVSKGQMKALSDQERLALWHDLAPAQPEVTGKTSPSRRSRHRHTMSTSDIPILNLPTSSY